jgi:hypothetical protein
VWKKHGSGGRIVVAYKDLESKIEYVDMASAAQVNEILAFQAAHKRR